MIPYLDYNTTGEKFCPFNFTPHEMYIFLKKGEKKNIFFQTSSLYVPGISLAAV